MPMPRLLPPLSASSTEPPPAANSLALQSFTYQDRRIILPALADAMNHSGCWVLERKALSLTQMGFRFEIQLRSVLELYSALIAAGLELTRGSHLDLTALCTLRKHNPTPADLGRVVDFRLEVSFLEELDLKSVLMPGAALA